VHGDLFATLSLTTSIEPGLVPRWLLRTTSGTALVCSFWAFLSG
jgi:hypothetical protein